MRNLETEKGSGSRLHRERYLNPLLSSAHKSARIAKISILKLEGTIKKISYERLEYESVDEKSLSYAMTRKTTKKKKRVNAFHILLSTINQINRHFFK